MINGDLCRGHAGKAKVSGDICRPGAVRRVWVGLTWTRIFASKNLPIADVRGETRAWKSYVSEIRSSLLFA
jgi:hypothetical protein